MKLATAVAMVVVMAGSSLCARGYVNLQVIDMGIPHTATDAAPGYRAYLLRLVSDSGNIAAVDFLTGNKGIYGPFVQRWYSSEQDGVYDVTTAIGTAQNLTSSATNFDSHLLAPGGSPLNMLAMGLPEETLGSAGVMPPPGSALPGGFPENNVCVGIGLASADGYMKVEYGIMGQAQSPRLDLAYVVAPAWWWGNIYGQAVVGDRAYPVVTLIPEPASTTLAALGGLAMLVRRWRGILHAEC